jgi:hypothetical protein
MMYIDICTTVNDRQLLIQNSISKYKLYVFYYKYEDDSIMAHEYTSTGPLSHMASPFMKLVYSSYRGKLI